MAEIILRTADNTHIATIKKFSCFVEEKLSTEKTLSFEVLLKGDISSVNDKLKYVVEFEGDFYDVTSIKKSLQNGIYQAAFECEHISYRLTDCKIAYFANNGTLKETLTKLLGGTGFSCGVFPILRSRLLQYPARQRFVQWCLALLNFLATKLSFINTMCL